MHHLKITVVWKWLFKTKYMTNMVALAIFPIIFLKDEMYKQDARLLNHERIHFAQTLELFILPFYAWYLWEYFKRRRRGLSHWDAYRQNPFEAEAYANDRDYGYLNKRKFWAFLNYF